jgi:hypothetical protein
MSLSSAYLLKLPQELRDLIYDYLFVPGFSFVEEASCDGKEEC